MMKFIFMLMMIFFPTYMNNQYKFLSKNYLFFIMFMFLMNMKFSHLYWSKIFYWLGIDNISFMLIMLTFWILSLSFLSNLEFTKKFKLNFNSIILMMMIIFFLCFSSMNMIYFYIFFESSLIPMMLLIMGWGSQIDRIQASMYMLFYTLFGSLPLLVILMIMYNKILNIYMTFISLNNLNNLNNLLFYTMMMIAFLIKLPMYFTHIWLPKAHVQAPISGSMILAGVMLKLGSYGIYRMILIFNNMNMKFNFMIMSISLLGSIYASLICMNQIDMKIIVAYSSVVHMNMMLASLITLNKWSFLGSFWMMIAHGLCSSGMFSLVNFNYERLKSRNLYINKGLMNIFPSLSLWWFLTSSSNFSAPPSLSLFSEMFMFNSLISYLYLNMIFIFLTTFLNTYYSIFLFSFTQHGKSIKLYPMKNMTIKEFLIIILHWLPLNILFLNLMIL